MMDRPAPRTAIDKRCPDCGGPVVFVNRYAVLAPRTELLRSGLEARVRYQPAWACRNGACHYHEWVTADE
jgi:ribosomal protein S27AE